MKAVHEPVTEQEQADGDSGPMDRRAARHKSIAWLSRREHSGHEIRRKLGQAGFDKGLIDEVVKDLQLQGLVSDERFTEAYIRFRSSKGYGPQRIEMELNEKGVDAALVESGLANSGRDWAGLAIDVRIKKYGAEQPAEYKERARQARFLQYRGFTGEQIRHALGSDG